MAQLSQVVGVVLIVLGIGGYVLSGMTSPTAMIPAFFGMAISMLGFYGRSPASSRTATYLAMGLAVVGLLGSVRGLLGLPALLSGATVARPAAVISQSLMAIILIAYLIQGYQRRT